MSNNSLLLAIVKTVSNIANAWSTLDRNWTISGSTYTWAPGTGLWGWPSNGTSASALFASPVTTNPVLQKNITASSVSFTAAGYTVSGNYTLTLTAATALTMTNAAGTTTFSNNIQFNAATATINLNNGGMSIFSGNLSGTNVTFAGAGAKFTLSGSNNFSGTIKVSNFNGAAIALFNSQDALGSGTATVDNSGGNNSFGNTSGTSITYSGTHNFIVGNLVTGNFTADTSIGAGTLTASGNGSVTWYGSGTGFFIVGSLNTSATSTVLNNSGLNLAISGAAGSNLMSYTLVSGTTRVGDNLALGSGPVTWNGGTLQAWNKDITMSNTVQLAGTNATVSGTQSLIFNGAVTGSSGAARTLTNNITTPSTLTINGAVNINTETANVRTLTISGTGNTVINGIIANGNGTTANGLIKSGTGTVTLSATNTYTGTTTVSSSSTLRAGANNAFGNNSAVNLSTVGATLDLNNFNATIGSLASVANSLVQLGTGTLTVGSDNTNRTVNGRIIGNLTPDSGGLVKSGLGYLSITSSSFPSYINSLNITGGQFAIAAGGVGSLSRSVGATFFWNTTNSLTGTSTLVNGIVGPWAFTNNGGQYIKWNSGAAAGYTGLSATSASSLTDTTGTENYDFSATSGTAPSTFSCNTIRYNGGSAGTLSPGATSFTVNGLMNSTGFNWTIGSAVNSGTVTIGNTKELVIVCAANANSIIIINSIIADNASGASSITIYSYAGVATQLLGSNTFSGDIYVNNGSLILGSGGSHATTTGNINLATGYGLTVNNNGNQSIGAIAGLNSSLTKQGTGILTLRSNSTYTGGTTINAGTLKAGSAGCFGSGSITVNTGATLDRNGYTIANTIINNGGTVI
jgi:autotransporter-associated beta strand protein